MINRNHRIVSFFLLPWPFFACSAGLKLLRWSLLIFALCGSPCLRGSSGCSCFRHVDSVIDFLGRLYFKTCEVVCLFYFKNQFVIANRADTWCSLEIVWTTRHAKNLPCSHCLGNIFAQFWVLILHSKPAPLCTVWLLTLSANPARLGSLLRIKILK